MELATERLILREFREEDYPFYCKLERNAHTLEYEKDFPPSQEQLNEGFNRTLAGFRQVKRIRYVLLLEKKEDRVPMGYVVIWKVDQQIAEWEMGWVVHPDYTGQGYTSEAVMAIIRLGFKQLGANRIYANCNDANLASERVMQKVGMKKEGVLRETRQLQGKWYGSCIYSILSREYFVADN